MDQVMFGTSAANGKYLMFVMEVKNMRKFMDCLKIFLGKRNGFYSNRFTGFDHFFQLFVGAGGNDLAVIHNGNFGADLLHFFHIMRSINNGGALCIQFLL